MEKKKISMSLSQMIRLLALILKGITYQFFLKCPVLTFSQNPYGSSVTHVTSNKTYHLFLNHNPLPLLRFIYTSTTKSLL